MEEGSKVKFEVQMSLFRERPTHFSSERAFLSRPYRSAMAKSLSYMEAIRIAEEREANVKSIFMKYDVDKSGTIDMDELLVLL